MNNYQISWEAISAISSVVQTIILLISAFAVVGQLRQIRQQSIESRITGLDTALKLLDNSEDFTKASYAAMHNGKVLGVSTWSSIFEVIDRVTVLIYEKYTDPDLLLKLKGHELAAIGKYLFSTQLPDEISQLLKSAKYKAVRELLDKSIKFVEGIK